MQNEVKACPAQYRRNLSKVQKTKNTKVNISKNPINGSWFKVAQSREQYTSRLAALQLQGLPQGKTGKQWQMATNIYLHAHL